MSRAAVYPLVVLLAVAIAPPSVRACSCPVIGNNRPDAIKKSFASTHNPIIYTGMVVAAQCNCIPGNEETPTDVVSASLNCQHFQLESTQSIINATLISRGECDLTEYRTEGYPPLLVCSLLGNTLVTWGLMVEGPVPPASGKELSRMDLTSNGDSCRFACPFNDPSEALSHSQPCRYTVRVVEVFKGNISVGDEMEEMGPDVLTSCGDPSRRLQISSQYVVGIGGACNPISEWSPFSSYSEEELQLLRDLSTGVVGTGGATVSCRASLFVPLLSLLACLWFSLIPPP